DLCTKGARRGSGAWAAWSMDVARACQSTCDPGGAHAVRAPQALTPPPPGADSRPANARARLALLRRGVPQLVEAQLWVLRIVGSNPISPTIHAPVAQLDRASDF